MTTANTPHQEPRKARRKVTTDLGRQLLQKERQRLSREQALLGEQLAEEAKRRQAQQQVIKKLAKPEQIAVSRGIVKRFAGVLASEGLNVRIIAQPMGKMSAWTDFEQIFIGYQQHDDVRLLAATMRGLAYHEGGHCRFTLPLLQLAEAAGINAHDSHGFHGAWNMLEDQRMETAVVSDSPRKAAYLSATMMTELLDTVDSAASNYPLIIWRRYLSKKVRRGARKLFVVKQSARGIDGEALAKAWEKVVTKYVLADNAVTMWQAVVEAEALRSMTYGLPATDDAAMGHGQQRRDDNKRDLSDALVIPIDPSMLEDSDTFDFDDEEAEVDVTDPEVARHLADVFSAIMLSPEKLVTIIYAVAGQQAEAEESEAATPQGSEGGTDDSKYPDEPTDEDDDEEQSDLEEQDDDADEEGDDPDDEDQPEQSHSNQRSDDDADDKEGGSTGTHDLNEVPEQDPEEDEDDDLTDQDLSDALQEAEDMRDNDPTLDGDVEAYHNAIEQRVSNLMPYETQVSTDLLSKAAAQNLATDLEESFQAATMDQAPAWVEQQRRGVLNVMRYKTRQPGDVEFFRQWTDDDQPGFNLSVSVLLDYSGSMSGSTEALAEAGYASKLACEKLGIPCTVSLWDTEAVVLWDANEKAEDLLVISARGGTDPTTALADLVNQRYEKAQHLVLIMTDGEWSGNCGKAGYLASYKEEGRVFIGLGYNGGGNPDGLANKLRRYGCDEAYGITNLMQIPQQLEQTLIALA